MVCRQGFKHVVSTALEVCDVIKSVGDSRSVDIDNLLIREALDVIGKVGFNHDFETVKVGPRYGCWPGRADSCPEVMM